MRRYAKGWVSSLFLGALALSFALWGIADIFTGGTSNVVYSVGSTDVGVNQLQREYQNALRNQQIQLSPEQSRLLGQQILDRMILRTALDNLVNSLGLTAIDGRVRQQVQAISAFNGISGSFDHDTFLRVIGNAGYSEGEFIEVTRRDAARTQLIRAAEGGYGMPADYARAIFAYIQERRAAEYVVLSPSSLAPIPAPSDKALSDYIKKNPDQFSTPEYRSVGLAYVTLDDVAKTIKVTDKQVKEDFDLHKTEYVTPETREIQQIGFASENDAKAAKAALDGGKTFDALATERKLAAADYKLGELTQADFAIDPARGKAAFGMVAPGVTGPVKGSFGWVLINVVKITPGTTKSNDEIRANLQKQLAAAKVVDMANALTDELGGGATMADAAKKAGMKFLRVADVDARGNGPDGKPIAAIASDPELLTAVFAAEVGEDGDPFPTKTGNYYAIRVDGVTPPKLKPLDTVRADALARWTNEQRMAQLRARAEALTVKANQDRSLTAVAASLGAPVQSSPGLNRGTNEGLFTDAVVRALFTAPAGGTIFAPLPTGGFIIARVSGIQHPVADPSNFGYVRGVEQLSGEIANDLTLALANDRKKRDGATINQKLVDTTFGGNSGSGS